MDEATTRRWWPHLRTLLPGARRTAVLAVCCNLALEVSRLTGVGGEPWKNKTPAFVLLFLLGSVVVWAVVGLIHALVGRFRVTVFLVVTMTVLLGVADYKKVHLRREPLYPIDWSVVDEVSSLQEMSGADTLVLATTTLAVTLGAVAAGAWLLRRRTRRRTEEPEHPLPPRQRLLVRVGTAGVCLLVLSQVVQFNQPGNPVRAAYDAFGAAWRPWSQQRNYLGNGFVGGYLYNLDVPTMAAPAGYSAAEMDRISRRYTRIAERINRTRDPQGLDDVNVVMLLSETFSDPTALRGVHLAEDPIPATRRLMGSTMSGTMLAQNIGGGTANMEFEALTGMSMSQFPPQLRVPYQMLVPQHETFPSAVRLMKQTGHRTVAIHPFTTELYRRRDVYRAFGFDEFIYDDRMQHQQTLGHDGYISDASAYEELLEQLESSPEPLFVHLVTMQNHIPYPRRYDDPVRVTGPDGEPMEEIGQYVRGLTHTDRATQQLIERLDDLGEETVVVFYGDHLPGVYPDEVVELNSRPAMHHTPFFVWASSARGADPQPVTSTIHFMDLALERAGAPAPPYYALLHELRQEIPAMAGGMMFGPDGGRLSAGRLPARAARVLRDYRLVQYDLAVGARHSEDAMFGTGEEDPSVRAAAR